LTIAGTELTYVLILKHSQARPVFREELEAYRQKAIFSHPPTITGVGLVGAIKQAQKRLQNTRKSQQAQAKLGRSSSCLE